MAHIVLDAIEGIDTAAAEHAHLPLTGHIGPHRLAVQAQVPGDQSGPNFDEAGCAEVAVERRVDEPHLAVP